MHTHTDKIAEMRRLDDEYDAAAARIPREECEEAFAGYIQMQNKNYYVRPEDVGAVDILSRVRASSRLVREWLLALTPDEDTHPAVKNAHELLLEIERIEKSKSYQRAQRACCARALKSLQW